MPLFDVRLESETDSQWRQVSLQAPNATLAKAMCARQERDLVNFSLVPTEPTAPAEPNSGDATVLVDYLVATEEFEQAQSTYEREADAGKAKLERLLEKHRIDANGKAVGPTKTGRAHLHAHMQQVPYRIASVTENVPSVAEFIRAAKALQEHAGSWDKALKAMRDAGLPMNVVTASLAGLTAQKQLDGSTGFTVWSSGVIQCSLHTAYTFNNDTHDFQDDVSSTEITGTGYTANGVTLASKTSTYDTATDQIRLDAADVSWTTSTLSATDAVLWVNTAGIASTDPVIGNVDFGATVTTTAGTFLITWDATGIIVYDVT